jgi:hypothetical protein
MQQDIGLDLDGYMEILIERTTPLPHEFTCRIKPNDLDKLTLFEGNRIETRNNHIIGKYTLENIKDGTFTLTLKVSEIYEMTILVDDYLLDKVVCSDKPDEITIEEEQNRRWLNARSEFRDYIQSTLLFIEDSFTKSQLSEKEWKWVVEKLEWAKQILCYEVSADEYLGALKEIENMINPVLQKTCHKKAFEKSPLME